MNKKIDYHYKACGLDNVVIVDMPVVSDDSGEGIVRISNIKGLHRLLSYCLVTQEMALRGKEIRFLRTEMGLTQAQMAEILRKDTQTVGRWERGECLVDQTADILIRQLVVEKLAFETEFQVEDFSRWSIPVSNYPKISINGANSEKYELAVA
ncbi:MAG: helix-turn-helix domain-containing protein [Robiginitomaculum sp.]|nr:helix-turn-helix domain-containing protein [Robiginitomaculum sp.]